MTQLLRPQFYPNLSGRTNTKCAYLTNITQSTVRVKGHFQVDPEEVLQVPLKLYHWLREGHKPQDPDAPNFRVRRTRRRIYTRKQPENKGTHFRQNSVRRVRQKNSVESQSGSRAESVFSVSDRLNGLCQHWQICPKSRQLPWLVAQDAKWQDMGKFQGPLRSSLQED